MLALHGANRPSHEGVVPLYDRAVCLCRQAGFTDILLRGDTDFSLTTEFDRWDGDGVRFVFGYDARANLIETGRRRPRRPLPPAGRHRRARDSHQRPGPGPPMSKRPSCEPAAIRPSAPPQKKWSSSPTGRSNAARIIAWSPCARTCRWSGATTSLFEEYRFFFYITNDWNLTADEVVAEARSRCNQENLIAQLKSGVRALHAPVNTLVANWAYMTMASLAWSLKAWCALLLPVSPRWAEHHHAQRRRLLRMEFRTFLQAFIEIPCQIIQDGRQIRWRIQAWNPWLAAFFRLLDAL